MKYRHERSPSSILFSRNVEVYISIPSPPHSVTLHDMQEIQKQALQITPDIHSIHSLKNILEPRRSCESFKVELLAVVEVLVCPGFKYCLSTSSSSRGTSPLHLVAEVLLWEMECWGRRISSTTASSSSGWVNCASSAGRLSLMLSVTHRAYTR